MSDSTGSLLIPALGRGTRWRTVQLVCTAVYVLGALTLVVTNFRLSSAVALLLAAFFTFSYWLRWRPTSADQDGIRRQGFFRATHWDDVEALIAPGRWDTSVHLRTAAGKDLRTGIPAEYLGQLAALSGKPVEQRLWAAANWPTRQQLDLSERAARVRARNCELMGVDDQS